MITREEYLKIPLKERFIKLDKVEEERAEELHRKIITIDLHSHILWGNYFILPRIMNSGVSGFVEAVPGVFGDFDVAMAYLGQFLFRVNKHKEFTPVYQAQDFRKAKKDKKIGVMFQLEPQPFGRNLDNVDIAYGHGIRMALLTFNSRNYVGDGCGERTDEGLSYFGLDLVERMNNVGMMIDLSHVGVKTTLDTIENSKDPVMCNHVGARSLYPQCKRIKTDEELKALAEKDGVAGVSAIPNQLSGDKEQGIENLLDHVDYMVNLIGINHVAIGLDNVFGDQVESHRRSAQTVFKISYIGQELNAPFMWGIESPEEWPNITRGLVQRGYSDEEIEKILGENSLKLMERVIG
ncbi:MAG: dipeptidase [Candidatus Heimdallarchaeota archaeon]